MLSNEKAERKKKLLRSGFMFEREKRERGGWWYRTRECHGENAQNGMVAYKAAAW